MPGSVFVAQGDITQLAADAVAYSTSTGLGTSGHLYEAFKQHLPPFVDAYKAERENHLPCEVGGAFWIDLPGNKRPYGVVVVAAAGGAGQPPQEERPGLAVEGALTLAIRRLRRTHPDGPLLVALPAFRMGKGGFRDQELQSARAQLRRAREILNRPGSADVDAAFITYTPQIYQLYLEARRREFGEPDPAPAPLETALCRGECVLFLGAGLSKGSGLPDWSELIAHLVDDLRIPHPVKHLDYLDVAQWYSEHERFGPTKLAEYISTALADPQKQTRPTLAHYLLLSLPVRYVITTNYDHLLEQALHALRRNPLPIIRQQEVARTGPGEGVYVIKFHGDISDPQNLVLTRDDYDQFFRARPAMASLLEGLLLNETIFFVGYSLRDPNLRQIYSRIEAMLTDALRPAFATMLYPTPGTSPYLQRQWANKGLNLILFEDAEGETAEHQLLCFLDRLADRVTTQTSQLLLARDIEHQGITEPLRRLRQHLLIEDVGKVVLETCCAPDHRSLRDIRLLTEVLTFLTAQGWRPAKWDNVCLSQLWENLAGHSGLSDADRITLLRIALRNTESMGDAERIRQKLNELGG